MVIGGDGDRGRGSVFALPPRRIPFGRESIAFSITSLPQTNRRRPPVMVAGVVVGVAVKGTTN